MPKFFIKTYGCQMNERDSEQVAHSLIARGYERVANEREADVVLLNTCSVRDMADQKALGKMGMMGPMAKERPHMVFGFLGCMAQARGGSLLKNLPHVDLVVGTQKFHHVADYVEELVASKTARSAIAPCQNRAMDALNAPRASGLRRRAAVANARLTSLGGAPVRRATLSTSSINRPGPSHRACATKCSPVVVNAVATAKRLTSNASTCGKRSKNESQSSTMKSVDMIAGFKPSRTIAARCRQRNTVIALDLASLTRARGASTVAASVISPADSTS